MKSALNAAHLCNEKAAIEYVEARLWPHGPVCPHCGTVGEASRSKGKTTRAGLWNCRACDKPFTVKIGTVFESSHIPLHIWLQTIYLFSSSKKGISTRQLQRTFGGSMKTAWFLGHRVRKAMEEGFDLSDPMGGAGAVVEADETWIGGKAENRAFGPVPPKVAVVSLVQRDGSARSFVVPRVTATNLAPIIARHVHEDSRFMTDESNVYAHAGTWYAEHQTVNHSAKEYVRGDVYTNTVEGYFSVLKRGIYGVYQHVSEAHLKRYLAEFDFRYSNRSSLGVTDGERTAKALKG